MNLRMIPTGLSMTHRTKLGDKAEKWERVTFELRHAGRDGLKLETGEVFQNPQWASYKKSQKNLITPAYLYVIALDSGRPSEMFYHEAGYGCNASIEFRVFIAQNDYDLLLDNLRAGLTPSLSQWSCSGTIGTKTARWHLMLRTAARKSGAIQKRKTGEWELKPSSFAIG